MNNQFQVVGNIGVDPLIRSKDKTLVVGFTVCENYLKGEEKEVNFFEVTAFDKLAEKALKNLKTGNLVQVQGSIKLNKWKDEETGKNRTKVEVIAYDIKMVDFLRNEETEIKKESSKPFKQMKKSFNKF